ncbi:hypothetical protein Y032_0858g2726, partial [Ancylostoma ceylanicum]
LLQCCCIELVARTRQGISLISVDDVTADVETSLLVPSISEELSVLLTMDTAGTCYFAMRDHLYSLTIDSGLSTDLGKFGHGIEEAPTAIAFEWITKKIFISFSGVGHDSSARIYVCSLLDITNCAVVLHNDLDYLHSLCLDPLDGYIYWLNGISNSIEKSFMNGQRHDRFPYDDQSSSFSKDVTYSSLTLDLLAKRLYFVKTQRKSSQIWYCELHRRDSCASLLATNPIHFFTTSKVNCNHSHVDYLSKFLTLVVLHLVYLSAWGISYL